ncbi:divergent protein kinase domain 2A-like [Glandiceps talaboti]
MSRRKYRRCTAAIALVCFVCTVIFFMQFTEDSQKDPFMHFNKLQGKTNILNPRVTTFTRKPVFNVSDTASNMQIMSVKGKSSKYPYDGHRCPACYGTSLCNLVESGHLHIDLELASETEREDGVYHGRLHSKKIVGKRLIENEQFDKLDEILCNVGRGNVGNTHLSSGKDCDIRKAMKHLFSLNKTNSTRTKLRNGLAVLQEKGLTIRPSGALLCGSDRLFDTILDLSTKGSHLEDTEEMMMRSQVMTSLLLNVEGQLLKFFSSFENSDWPFPRYYGECGRVVIVEDAGKTLYHFYDASWEKRVQIVLDVFKLIDQLLTGNDDWFVILADLTPDNFGIAPSGYLGTNQVIHFKSHGGLPCNINCFTKFAKNLLSEPDKYRPLVTEYVDFPYTSACLTLMTDHPLDQNRTLFNDESIKVVQAGGLLHNPPSDVGEKLTKLISSCVTEGVRGERLQVVRDLKQLLKSSLGKR